jgi:hypothetical protein
MIENMQQSNRATKRNPKDTNAVLNRETAYPFKIKIRNSCDQAGWWK